MLKAALSDLIIFSQVSFSALLTAKSLATRAVFNRKFTDFVICDYDMHVLLIVELDDLNHEGNEENDAYRDRLLTDAGYSVVRFRGIPDAAKVRSEIKKQMKFSH